MLHLACAHRGITPDLYPCDIIGPLFYEDDILQSPFSLNADRALPPNRPGLGVDLDDTKVEKYRVR